MKQPATPIKNTHPVSEHRVMIIEDDLEVLGNFSAMLQQADGIKLVATATDFASGLALVNGPPPHALLVDLRLPGGSGLDLIAVARNRWGAQCNILVITVLADSKSVLTAIQHGADGYLVKWHSARDFIQDIRDLLDGGAPISPQIAKDMWKWCAQRLTSTDARKSFLSFLNKAPLKNKNKLSPQEIQTLQILERGFSYGETAEKMGLDIETVRQYVKRIIHKIQVASQGKNQGGESGRRTLAWAIYKAHELEFF